jgi:lipopolysaccharide export LptBFGC system permease protein LptF
MILFHVSSRIWFRDESGEKTYANVFVMAENKEEAKEKAIVAFKKQLVEQDQTFEELQATGSDLRAGIYEEDVSVEALHKAARGEVDITVNPEVSQVHYF